MTHFTLVPHSLRPGFSVQGEATIDTSGLILRFEVQGNIEQIDLPAPVATPQFLEGLWEHTCFEFFAGRIGEPGYQEWNFSPSTNWWQCAFSDYRRRSPVPRTVVPSIRVQASRQLEIESNVPSFEPGPWQCSPCAVLKTKDGKISYWALHHPASNPDFHDRGAFLLTL